MTFSELFGNVTKNLVEVVVMIRKNSNELPWKRSVLSDCLSSAFNSSQ